MNELKKLLENAGVNQDTGEDREYRISTPSGDEYIVYYMGWKDLLFIEVNGVSVATAKIGGGGVMDVTIEDPKKLMEVLFAFAENNQR